MQKTPRLYDGEFFCGVPKKLKSQNRTNVALENVLIATTNVVAIREAMIPSEVIIIL